MGGMLKPLCMIIVVKCMKEIASATINKIGKLAEMAEKEESEG